MKKVGVGSVLWAVVVLGGIIWFLSSHDSDNSPPVQTANASTVAPKPIESPRTTCQSGWTQRNSTIYFLNPEGCGPTKLVLSAGKDRLHLAFMNQFASGCEKYDSISGVAYDSVKLVDVDVDGIPVQFSRFCLNGDEMFEPHDDKENAKLFAHAALEDIVTIKLNDDVFRYKHDDYLKAADNLIEFNSLNP